MLYECKNLRTLNRETDDHWAISGIFLRAFDTSAGIAWLDTFLQSTKATRRDVNIGLGHSKLQLLFNDKGLGVSTKFEQTTRDIHGVPICSWDVDEPGSSRFAIRGPERMPGLPG